MTHRSVIDIHQTEDKNSVKGAPIQQVGMEEIELPVTIPCGGKALSSVARMSICVDLTSKTSKGIHMSRLYLLLQEYLSQKPTDDAHIVEQLLAACVKSHDPNTEKAFLTLSHEWALERASLKSHKFGWKVYPYEVKAMHHKEGYTKFCQNLVITYSSTCPCSAALARQLIQEKFLADCESGKVKLTKEAIHDWLSKDSNILATPHGQRSKAFISLIPKKGMYRFDELTKIIDLVENELQTPVQSVVKREDEQEFARLNGSHLMFSEDAVRAVDRALASLNHLAAYKVKVAHFESLHPHDAIAVIESPEWTSLSI